MLNLLAEYHENVVYPATEILVGDIVKKSEVRLTSRIDGVEKRLDDIDSKLEHLEDDMGEVKLRLGNIEKKVDYMKEEFQSQQEKQDTSIDRLEVGMGLAA